MRLVIFALMLAACGRVNFDPLASVTAADASDAPIDSAPACSWSPPVVIGGSGVLRSELSTPTRDADPTLSRTDYLTMYFVTQRDGSDDFYVAHRPSLDAPFASVTKLSSLNTATGSETALMLEPGDLHGYYAGASGGDVDLFEVVRPDLASPFTIVRPLTELNDTRNQYDPWPSDDGLTLLFSSDDGVMAITYSATRSTTTDPWSNLTPLSINLPGQNVGATTTSDRRVIVWSSNGAGGDFDIYYAVRESAAMPFGPPQRLDGVNTSEQEFEPSLRSDGCELFFSRGPGGAWDIFSVAIAPP